MIEALAVLLVIFVAALVWLVTRVLAATMKSTPAAEQVRIEQYLGWLEDRRRHAEAHGYDDDMKARIQAEFARSRQELAAVQAILATDKPMTTP